jgi:hypothetical protein
VVKVRLVYKYSRPEGSTPKKKKKEQKRPASCRAKNMQEKLQGAMGEVLQNRKSLRDAA